MLRVFLCWSGERSRQTAAAMKIWLEMVFQGSHIFMSESTIKGGQRWQDELQAALEQLATGLCILNSENIKSQWIAFEAGSLGKAKDGRVTPVLCGIGDGDLKDGPLAQFQAKHLTRSGLKSLVTDLNDRNGTPVPASTLDATFDAMWDRFGQAVLDCDARHVSNTGTRPQINPIDEVIVRLDRLERSIPEIIQDALRAESRRGFVELRPDGSIMPFATSTWSLTGGPITTSRIVTGASVSEDGQGIRSAVASTRRPDVKPKPDTK